LTPTTTIPVWFKDQIFASSTAIIGGNVTANSFIATGTVASTLPYASSTALTVSGSLYNTALGTGCVTSVNGLLVTTGSNCGVNGQVGSWATSTSGVANQLLNYSLNSTDIVAIGGSTGTSSAKFFFDPNTQFSYLAGRLGVGSTSPFATLAVNPVAGAAANQFVVGSSTATSLIVTNSGNVGVGTTTPGFKLGVNGSIGGTSANIGGVNIASNSVNADSYFDQSGSWYVKPAGAGGTAALLNGIVGVGTSTPWATLAVNPIAGAAANQFVVGSSTATSFIVNNSGFVGIGTSSPSSIFSVNGVVNFSTATTSFSSANGGINLATGCYAVRGECIGSSGGSGSVNTGSAGQFAAYAAGGNTVSGSTLLTFENANVGVGSTSPYAKLGVMGDVAGANFLAYSTTATSTFAGGLDVGNGGLVYDFATGRTSIDYLSVGAFTFDTNAGFVSWADLPVTSDAPAGTIEGYMAQINGNPLLTLYSESDGAGSVRSLGVSVGSSSPYAKLSVWGSGTANGKAFEIANNASTTIFSVLDRGLVSFLYGSSTALTVSGTGYFGNILATGSTTLQNFTALNATTTNATTTTLFATTASSTNFFATNGNVGTLTSGNLTAGTILATGSTTLQNFTGRNATTTNATSTNLFAGNFVTTNGTSTSFFAGSASTTNLFATAITAGLINGQNISSAANFTGTLNVTSGLTTLSNLLLTGSTTLQNFTGLNATTTNATSTTLFSTLLSTNTLCISTDCRTAWPANAAFAFTPTTNYGINVNSTTSPLWFRDQIFASSTAIFGGNVTANSFIATGTVASILPYASTTALSAGNFASTNATSTNLFATNFVTTNGTSTSFFSTTASTTNLFATNGNIGTLTSGTLTTGTLTSGTILATGSTTLQNFTGLNATTTNATSTTLFSTLLSTNTLCISTDCRTAWPANAAFAFTPTTNYGINVNSTTSPLWFRDQIFASSTAIIGGNVTANSFIATGTVASILPYASTTALTVSGTGYFGNILATGSTTLQNFTALNATTTNATTTTLFATTASSTNFFATNGNVGTLTSANLTAGTILATGSTTLQNFTGRNATTTNATSTNLFAGNFVTTNGTSTSFFAGSASTTNLFATAITAGLINGQNISSAANFTGTLNVTSGLTTLSNLLLTGSTTLQNFTGLNATTTNATSTTLFSTLLSTNTLCISTDCRTAWPANAAFAFTPTTNYGINVNSTTSPLWFRDQIFASSTAIIGGNVTANSFIATGTVASILPYASTTVLSSTGNAYFATSGGNVGIGTTTPDRDLVIARTVAVASMGYATLNSGITNNWTTGITWNTTGGNYVISKSNGLNAVTPGANDFFVISSNGNVGIGTTSPFAKLSIGGGDINVGGVIISTSTTASSVFPYASTTAISASTICISTDCRTAWPSSGGGAFAFDPATNFNQNTNSTTTTLWLRGSPYSLFASSTSVFDYASTTALTVSGTGYFTNILATGSTTLQNFTGRNATTTNATSTNLFAGNFVTTNGTSTSFFAGSASTTNLFATAITAGLINGQNISSAANFTGTLNVTSGLTTLSNLLLTGSTTLQNFTGLNATTTNATSTTLFSTLLSTNTLCISTDCRTAWPANAAFAFTPTTNYGINVNSTTSPLWFRDQIFASSTAIFGGNVTANSFIATGTVASILPYASTTALTVSGTGYFGNILATGSTTLQNFTGLNATTTNATSTNLFAGNLVMTNGTSTSFFAGSASTTNLFATAITAGLYNGQTIGSATNFTGTVNATGGLVTIANLLHTGSTTLQNFTGLNATTTNATSTTLFSTLLSTNTLCISTDCRTAWPANAAFAFTPTTNYGINVNSTTSPLWFRDQIFASSTAIFGGNVTANSFIATGTVASILPYASTTALSAGNFASTNATSTNLFATNFVTTNGTSTSWFSTTASTTNLFAGRIGVGTSSPGSILSVQGVANFDIATSTFSSTGGINLVAGCFAIRGVCVGGGSGGGSGTVNSGTTGQMAFYAAGGTAVSGTSTLIALNENIGIGTSSPYSKLSVSGTIVADNIFATSTTATSTFAGGLSVGGGALQYDFSTGITSIDNLTLGAMSFDTNAGLVSWADLPVTSGAAIGTPQGYSAQINGNPLLTLYSESDGAGSVRSLGVSVGSSSPYAKLSVWGNGVTTGKAFEIANNASTTIFSVTDAGLTTLSNLLATGSTTLQNFTGRNATTTNATSTNLFSTLLSTNNLCISNDCKSAWPSAGGGAFPFVTTTNYGINVNSTTSPLWFQDQIFASSTAIFAGNVTANSFIATGTVASILPYASSTALSATTLCISTDCRTSWPTSSGGAFPFITTTNYNQTANSTTTALWLRGSPISLMASSTSIFEYATTTALSISGTTYFPGNSIFTASGNLGIGTSSPYAKLSVVGAGGIVMESFNATSTTATSTIAGGLDVGNGGLTYDLSTGITSIAAAQLGAMNFDDDAGAINWTNLPVTSAGSGLVQSYTASIDDSPLLTLFGLSDGSGGVNSLGVSVGSTSPYSKLSVWGDSATTGSVFSAINSASSTLFQINNNGNVAVGSTTPGTLFGIQSVASFTTGTSTFVSTGGLNLLNGCFAVRGTCVGSGTGNGSGTVNSGTLGQFAYYAANGTIVDGNSLLTYSSANTGRIGIGTSTPGAKLSVAGDILGNAIIGQYFVATSTTATSTFAGGVQFGSGTGDSVFQFGGDSVAWTLAYLTSDNSFRIASSTSGVTNSVFTITKAANVGVGTTTPWKSLAVTGTLGLSSSLTSGSTGNYLCINNTTFEVTTGTTCSASSERFKENITPLTYGLDAITALEPVSFTYKSTADPDPRVRLGFIAERVQEILPELVNLDKDGLPESVDYAKLAPVLTKAIQELNAKVDFLAGIDNKSLCFIISCRKDCLINS
jgi:hypothetical protein